MDVALIAPYNHRNILDFQVKWNVYDWFAMVHGIPVKNVIERLENLKRKSLLENLGDGLGRIGMHDLWREFARLETKVGEFEKRRWIFQWDECNAFEDVSVPRAGCWVNVMRMFFLDRGVLKLEDVNFACFPNVTVLKLSADFANRQDLDLRGFTHLKSLELERTKKRWGIESQGLESQIPISLSGLGSLSKLGFLRWSIIPSDSFCIGEIVHLTNLQVLNFDGYGRVPNLSSLIFLQVVRICDNDLMATVSGLSSMHTNLQFLELSSCRELQSCWGVGELVALQELCLYFCCKLKELPNLQKLKQLRKLNVNFCFSLTRLPGLGDLVSLLELHSVKCINLVELPELRNLVNLRIFDVSSCKRVKSLTGLDELVCLQFLMASGCTNLTQLLNLYKLTNLQTLVLDPNRPLQSAAGLSDLISLRSLHVGIDELHDGPDLRKLTKLESLRIVGWQGQGFLSLAELVSLEFVIVENCKGVRVLPVLERLSRLRTLEFKRCEFEDMSSLSTLTSLEELKIMICDKLKALPDLRELARLKELTVERCMWLADVRMCGILELRYMGTRYPWLHGNFLPLPPDLDFFGPGNLRAASRRGGYRT